MEAGNGTFSVPCVELFHVWTLYYLPLSLLSRLTHTVLTLFPSESSVLDQRRAVISIWSVAFVWCLLLGFFCIYYVPYFCASIKTKLHISKWGLWQTFRLLWFRPGLAGFYILRIWRNKKPCEVGLEGWEAVMGGHVHGAFCTALLNKKSTCVCHILSVSVQHHPSKMSLCPTEKTNLSVLCSPQQQSVGAAEVWHCSGVNKW